jgi:hypothetical protein
VNMHKLPKTKLITMSTHQEHVLSKHSLPMTLSSMTKNGHVIKKIDDSSLDLATSVQITWCIQKNRQNGQKIKLSAVMKNPAICPIWGALRMVMRAQRLAQPDNILVACYRTKKAPLLFIIGSRIATLLCKAVKKVRPSTSADDLKKYSAHSLHVWACVLLDKAGMSPSFIQKRLRRLGDLFKMYLRDMKAIQDKHLEALQSASSDAMALICTPPDDVVRLTANMSNLNIPSNIVEDDQMGVYIDEMD